MTNFFLALILAVSAPFLDSTMAIIFVILSLVNLFIFILERKLPTREEIEREAYRLWEEKGKPDGKDTEFWLLAERNLGA